MTLPTRLQTDAPSRRDRAEADWGPDPQTWPAWNCGSCPQQQRNSGWALQCGRCGAPRP